MKLKRLVDLLDLLEFASKQMCREDEPIPIQVPIARALTSDIHPIMIPSCKKFGENTWMAMFLDPRFKDKIVLNKVEFRTRVAIWIREQCRQDDYVEISAEQ
uniref:Uncharacterized protein n=1 Tax=Ditylenchus dipsaci TaxID=166011 RepID=A0A915DA32_9BILA